MRDSHSRYTPLGISDSVFDYDDTLAELSPLSEAETLPVLPVALEAATLTAHDSASRFRSLRSGSFSIYADSYVVPDKCKSISPLTARGQAWRTLAVVQAAMFSFLFFTLLLS